MLKEWFEYVITPAPRYARHMGYVSQIIATKARYGRQHAAWQKHIEHTKDVILKAANAAPHKRKVLVLGAGNLYDVPLVELSRQFDEVLLVDVAFLRCTKNIVAAFDNVHLHETDVTGMAELMLAGDEHAARAATPNMFVDDAEVDLVVSCNIASQLPFNLLPYLADDSPQAQYDFCTHVINKHLKYLAKFNGTKLLVTDVVFFVMENGNVQTQPALCGATVPELMATWRWDVAPPGEVEKESREWHEVGATLL